MKAWHFVGATLRDGSPIPSDGVTLRFPGTIKICERGYHASLNPFDALQYAPGNTLCLVEMGGKMEHQNDKLVAEERTILARIDATFLLREFAKKQALSVINLWDPPQIVIDYLNSTTEELRDAARDAAWAASRDATWDAAGDATWDAARDASRDATWDATWAAARAAARASARADTWAAARASARDAKKQLFTPLVENEFKEYL